MTDLGCPGAGYKLMVNCLVKITLGKFFFRRIDPAAHKWRFQDGVDLIKCEPVFYLIFITVENCSHIPFIKSDEITVYPTVIMLCKIKRSLIMR